MSETADVPRHPPPDQARPEVVLDVDYTEGAFELVLVNLGAAVAFQPRVEFEGELIGAGGDVVISDLPIWKRLGLLRPGKAIRVFLDADALVYRRKTGRKIRAVVTYFDEAGRPYEQVVEHDLDAYRGMPQISNRA